MPGPKKQYQKIVGCALPLNIGLELKRIAVLRQRTVRFIVRQLIIDYVKKQREV